MNAIYPKAKEQFLQGGLDLSGDVKAALIDLGEYTYNSAHEFFDDIPSEAVIAVSGNLTSKTFTDGVFDAANPTFDSVSGASIEAAVLFLDTGNPATSRLIAFFDTDLTGVPLTPDGSDIRWNFDDAGVFAL